MSEDYEVGYCKPPKHSRWQKGQSGFPPDRPRKKKQRMPDVQGALIKAINSTITINDNGQRREVTALEVLFKQAVNKAAAGNSAQLRWLVPLLMKVDEVARGEQGVADAGRRTQADLKKELDEIFSNLSDEAKDIPPQREKGIPMQKDSSDDEPRTSEEDAGKPADPANENDK